MGQSPISSAHPYLQYNKSLQSFIWEIGDIFWVTLEQAKLIIYLALLVKHHNGIERTMMK